MRIESTTVPCLVQQPVLLESLRGNPLVLAVAMGISTFASTVATPFMSPYFLLVGGNDVLLGVFWATFSIVNLLVILPGGYIADTLGRKRVLTLMTFLTGAAFLLLSGSPSWGFLFVPQALLGIATLSDPARDAILADSMPQKKRSTGFALVFALSSVGWTFGPLVGGYLYDNMGVWGIRIAFLFSAVGAVIAGLVYYTFLKETLLRKSQSTNADQKQNFSVSLSLRRFLSEMSSAISQMTTPVKRFLAGYMFYQASSAIVSAYWSLLILYALGFSGVELGFIEMAAGLSLIAFSIPMGKLSDRIGRPRATLLIALCSALVLAWVVNTRLLIEVLVIGSLLDVFDPRPSIHGLRADVLPHETRGRMMALLSVAGYATAAVSAFAGGILYAIVPQFPFYLSGGLLVTSGVFFASTSRFKQHAPLEIGK